MKNPVCIADGILLQKKKRSRKLIPNCMNGWELLTKTLQEKNFITK